MKASNGGVGGEDGGDGGDGGAGGGGGDGVANVLVVTVGGETVSTGTLKSVESAATDDDCSSAEASLAACSLVITS